MLTVAIIIIIAWYVIKRFPFRFRGEEALRHIPYKEDKEYHFRDLVLYGDVLQYACTLYHHWQLYTLISIKRPKTKDQYINTRQYSNLSALFKYLYNAEAAGLLEYSIDDITCAFQKIARDYRDTQFAKVYPIVQNEQVQLFEIAQEREKARRKYEQENLERQMAQARYEQQLLTDLTNQGITPHEYLTLVEHGKIENFVGCYIIFNQDKEKAYVGQAKNVRKRLQQHFSGNGCHELYYDYLCGDKFCINTISLREYGIDDLDKMEKELIAKYHAFDRGYNKTRGNG